MSTDTPRTDAQGYGDGRHPYVPTEFARQLERELAEALSDLEFRRGLYALQSERVDRLERELQERAESWRMSSVCRAKEAVIARLEFELAAERSLADRLAGVLTLYNHDLLAGEMIQFVPAHDEALAAWKEARHE